MRLMIVLLAASVLFGQEKEKPSGSMEAAIIPVKTLSGDSFDRLAKMLGVFNVRYTADNKLRTILVYAPKDVVAQMRHVVEQLDQPGSEAAIGRNIEMTLAFLRCSTKPQPNERPLPPDLEPVAKQLRAFTEYKNIQLWDIEPLRVQEGNMADQILRLPGDLPNSLVTGHVKILPEAVSRKDGGRYVRFSRVVIYFNVPNYGGPGSTNVSLETAGDFKEGQKTVLGKISGIEANSAVFVVISLKVLD